MIKYTIKKILGMIPMLLIITFIIYWLLDMTPGDPISYLMDPEALARLSEEQIAALRMQYGLDAPFIVRYFKWLGRILQGDFGYSSSSGVPVIKIMAERLPATLELAVAALLISTVLGSFLGVLGAIKKGSISDNVLTVAGMIGVSIPQFFFGVCAILIFALKLQWLPVGGRTDPSVVHFIDRIKYLILPASVLGISMTAGVMRYARSSMLDTMNKDYIKTARSKGLPEWRVNLIHGFRVSLTPVIVLIGFRLPSLIAGSVVIETVFQWPGIGSAFNSAVRSQNYNLVMMLALLFVFMTLFASTLVDILTAALDPRVKLNG
ncbi:ABC transporter permease [Defluviitalea raffinosedens]|uniref:ABC transporter permease subunit n=1 Tax=Defluviitalea raffinosedens TaxID=1450156 RepID=A0A7C8HDW1_9FIRM|nr:ABC transporter permease [Defluviitalea raffinosedens]KAE9631198.1 ABC transporter permease subunit [Defluviitalea raffinosedens]MBM7686276.1 peptide/nickel transport system permease protein [Defluviitalea raffinosedens]HHW68617.1 ABC transporter permease [Candidatus Epulonipiscium sp.]